MVKRCIILASGSSVIEGFTLGLNSFLEKEVVFSINDNIKFIDSTVAMFGDWCAYRDRFDLFKEHPLVIGRQDMHIGKHIEGSTLCPKHDGLILLKSSGQYYGDEGLKKGLYSGVLTGAFTLNLALRLGFTQIYMLGFDNCEINGRTHWYEGIEDAGQFKNYEGKPYTGVGKNKEGEYNTSVYNKQDVWIKSFWKPFEKEVISIFNVSLESRIPNFPKIGYHSLLKILRELPLEVNQDEVRKEIKTILQPYNRA